VKAAPEGTGGRASVAGRRHIAPTGSDVRQNTQVAAEGAARPRQTRTGQRYPDFPEPVTHLLIRSICGPILSVGEHDRVMVQVRTDHGRLIQATGPML
jgi:hypothetical protein